MMHRSVRQQPVPPRTAFRENPVPRPLKPPERPLVPYMRFSRKMWPKVRQDNPDIQLLEIGKMIGQLWRDASEVEKVVFQQEYEMEKLEYDRNLKAYQAALANQHVAASRSRASNVNVGSSAAIQPVDEEDPFEMTRKRLSALRYERDNRLMGELFTSTCLPDTRTIVPQTRIEQFRQQVSTLSSHQNKLNEELDRLEENFQKRKKTLEKNSANFVTEIEKLHDDRPVFTEELYREYVQMWTEYYLKSYEEHKNGGKEPSADESAPDTAESIKATEAGNGDDDENSVTAEKMDVDSEAKVSEEPVESKQEELEETDDSNAEKAEVSPVEVKAENSTEKSS